MSEPTEPKARIKTGGEAKQSEPPDVRTAFIACTRALDPLSPAERKRVMEAIQFWYKDEATP